MPESPAHSTFVWRGRAVFGTKVNSFDAVLALLLGLTIAFAILTLWVQAYWPVGLFEIAAFSLAAAAVLADRTPPRRAVFLLFVLGFVVLWGCIQLVAGWSSVRFETVNSIWKWTSWLAISYVAATALSDAVLSEWFRIGLVWFGVGVSVEAILQAFLSPEKIFGIFSTPYHSFVMGPILYHTHFAAFIEAILPIALTYAFSDQKRAHVFLGLSAVLITAVVVSASRGGLIIIAAEIVTVILLLSFRGEFGWGRMGGLALALAAATVVMILVVGFSTVFNRFHAEAMLPGRTQFARSSLHMILARPWRGFGLGCWPAVYPAFASFDPGAFVNQAHCDWLQWIAEGGLPVGVAMLSLLVWAVRPAVRSIWGLGAIAVLAHAAFDYPFSRPAVGALPLLVLAIAAAMPVRVAGVSDQAMKHRAGRMEQRAGQSARGTKV